MNLFTQLFHKNKVLNQSLTLNKMKFVRLNAALVMLLTVSLQRTNTEKEFSPLMVQSVLLKKLLSIQMLLLERLLLEKLKDNHSVSKTMQTTHNKLENVFQILVPVPKPMVVELESDTD